MAERVFHTDGEDVEAILEGGDLRGVDRDIQAGAVSGNGNGGAVALAGIVVDEILGGDDSGGGGEVLDVLRGIEFREAADFRIRPKTLVVHHADGEDMKAEGERGDDGWIHFDIEAAPVTGDGNGGAVALAGIGIDEVFGFHDIGLDPAGKADAEPEEA